MCYGQAGNHSASPAEERESTGVKLRETSGKKQIGGVRSVCLEGRKARTVLVRSPQKASEKNKLSSRGMGWVEESWKD